MMGLIKIIYTCVYVFQSVNMTDKDNNKTDFLHKCFIFICQHCAKDNTATTATILISAKVDNLSVINIP